MPDISSGVEAQFQPQFFVGMTDGDRREWPNNEVPAIFEMKVHEFVGLWKVPIDPRPDRLLCDST